MGAAHRPADLGGVAAGVSLGTRAASLLVERISGGRDAPPRRIALVTD